MVSDPVAPIAPPPSVAVFPPPPPPLAALEFPIGWLLDHASAPIRYRSAVEVARLDGGGGLGLSNVALNFAPAINLAVRQAADGVWNEAMLSIPPHRGDEFENVGTIHAVRRLVEYGWDKETPPIHHARRALFRLLSEDNDPSLLYELAPAPSVKLEPEQLAHIRVSLREAAAAALAQAGFESDPRLRGAASRILERTFTFLKSPVAEKPWIRIGNKQVLAAEAAPPSVFALHMLAHMPLFRNEHYEEMEFLYRWLTRPLPRQEQVQLMGKRMVNVPNFVLGDRLPHRNAVEDDVPAALAWLELIARLGFLRRNEGWMKLYERFIDDCGRDGIWHPHKGMSMPRSSNAWCWATYPLEPSHAGDDRWTDATFRIGLIARLSGRPITLK